VDDSADGDVEEGQSVPSLYGRIGALGDGVSTLVENIT
jgi:hypothetical protein